jgi:glucokinase
MFSADNCFILAGDIGGTNTTVALMEICDGRIQLRKKQGFASRSISGLEEAIDQALPGFKPELGAAAISGACFTAAGPVNGNVCQLTNLSWKIDGKELAQKLGYPVHVINDLSGICYGIPLLDPDVPEQLVRLTHPDGRFPAPQELWPGTEVRAVIAPGTGLGIGYLIHDRGNYLALPAEAGHINWAPFSDETRELQAWLQARNNGRVPGPEQVASGIGLENLFEYFVEYKKPPQSPALKEIIAIPRGERGAAISKHSHDDATCGRIMELFVEIMARFCSSVALWMLPKAGLYIAGGIPGKNQDWFVKDSRFMKSFLQNYLKGMEDQLVQVPVYLAVDYGINLFGAAHGFHCLNGHR